MAPSKVNIVEVGPRDGLQNEPHNIPTTVKIDFINALSQTGLSYIEATSFVSPEWVPQMADHCEVMRGIDKSPDVCYSALVPNKQGFTQALSCGLPEIAVFTTTSETFCQKNTNCSIAESLERIQEVIDLAKPQGIRIRGYLSCVLGCPYEGTVAVQQAVNLAKELIAMGCYQVSLGDTIGIGTAKQVQQLITSISRSIHLNQLAVHFHNTYGQALTNIYAALNCGIRTVDSAVAGLGGCPYAPGAGGNVATEDVVYLLNGLGYQCGVDLNKLINASEIICDYLQMTPRSPVAVALKARNSQL